MSKTKNKTNPAVVIWLVVLGFIALGVLIAFLLRGSNIALFNPKGLIASEQLNLIIFITGWFCVVAIPTIFLLFNTAWKYRESNTKADYAPDTHYGKLLDFAIWTIPALFVLVAVLVMVPATQKLEPKRQIAAGEETMIIDVIATRWKWVFLYPEQNIATVNFVQFPVDKPVEFRLTADEAPMSAFWIPNLGGMLYAMTSHVNRLNLIAEETGDYPGSTAEINGKGFAGMKFTARVTEEEDFIKWVSIVRQKNNPLSSRAYDKLIEPSENHLVTLYSSYESGLYDKVLMKYMDSSDGHAKTNGHEGH